MKGGISAPGISAPGISAPGISDTDPGPDTGGTGPGETGPGEPEPGEPEPDTGDTDPGEPVPVPEPETVLDPSLYYTIPAAWSNPSEYPGLQDITDRFDALYEINQSFATHFAEDVIGSRGDCTLKNYIVYTVELDESFFDHGNLTILQRTAMVMFELTSCVLNQGTIVFDTVNEQYADGCYMSLMSRALDSDACLSRHWDDLIIKHKEEYGTGGTLRL